MVRRLLHGLTATLAVAVLTLVGPATTATAAEAPPPPTVTLVPAEVTLAAGDVVDVVLVVDNPSTDALSVVAVDAVRTPYVDATVDAPLPVALPGRSSTTVPIRVTAGEAAPAGQVAVLVTVAAADDVADAPRRTLSTTLAVTAVESPGGPTATFVVFPDKLNDGDERRAGVRLVNDGSATYRDVVVRAVDSDDVRLRAASDAHACPAGTPGVPGHAVACLDELGPGGTALLDLTVSADERVRTGTQQVGITVSTTRDLGSGAPTALPVAAVATEEIAVSVFGVDVLSPFGISTLFVLPGLLAVVVFVTLARAVYPRSTAFPDTVSLTDLRFMPVIVPVSAATYSLCWLLFGQNLTREVSTAAVGLLFAFGFGFGLVVWIVVGLLHRQLVGRKRFKVDDDCETVLERLLARGVRTATLPEFTHNGLRYLYLAASGDGAFGAPPMRFTLTAQGDAGAINPERDAFNEALDDGDLQGVLDALRSGTVDLEWAVPSGVRTFTADEVTVHGSGRLLTPGPVAVAAPGG